MFNSDEESLRGMTGVFVGSGSAVWWMEGAEVSGETAGRPVRCGVGVVGALAVPLLPPPSPAG
jgi:hypothetical protein